MRYIIITDSNVANLYGEKVVEAYRVLGHDVDLIIVAAGEASKSIKSFESIASQMADRGLSRDTTVVALGGGMITDLAGFVASVYCRGVPLICLPTSLLAMVDAAVGGKTAINLSHAKNWAKNWIGSYYFPQKIILYFPFLETLPETEWENGIVEILKIGLIADPTLFYDASTLSIQTLVFRAIEAKRRIVAQDPYETGCRSLLNLGHTVGHALEALSEYTLSHGRAVAMGIVIEARLSYELGLLPANDWSLIEASFPKTELSISATQLMNQLKMDKKSRLGVPHFVLLEAIGRPHLKEGRFCHPVPEEVLTRILYDAGMCPC